MNMPSKKIICAVLSAAMLASVLTACSSKQVESTTTAAAIQEEESTAPETQPVTEAEKEIISFTDTDKDANTLTLVPIFDKDEKTVAAGYIISAKDKKGKALDAKKYSLLNKVVSASGKDDKITLDKDKDKNLIQFEAYSDLSGTLVAIKDKKDVNKNKNSDEFLKLSSKTDNNKVKHYVIDYTSVKISKESNKYFMTDGKNKTEVKKVDSSNTAVIKKVNKEIKENKKNKEAAKKAKKTTAKPTQATTEESHNYIDIVLEKNRKVSCSSPNVSQTTGEVQINKGGYYRITSGSGVGEWHGQIILRLKNTEECEVRFENVKITNNTKNIIQILDTSIKSSRSFLEAEASADQAADDEIKEVADNNKAPNVSLSFPTGTSSCFETQASSYTGVIYNESKLTIKGNGKASIVSKRNANNCICSTKSITVKNVSLSLETAQNTNPSSLASAQGGAKGIFSYSKVNVESGSLNIRSNGDAIRCDSFYSTGGTTDIKSSACDAIDADDAIVISAGNVTAVATEKSSFKVRRVNNSENPAIPASKGIRKGRGDTFEINGGTVVGESKKISTVQTSSKQPSITCRIVKKNAGNSDLAANESKIPQIISIESLKASRNECTKFLYSSSAVKKGTLYTVNAKKSTPKKMTKDDWKGTVGTVRIESSQNR